MVQTTNKYILGGTYIGYIMVPDIESFQQFCKVDLNIFSYISHPFRIEDLILIDFPAYFYLDKESNYWIKVSKEKCLQMAETDIQSCESLLENINYFKSQIIGNEK